MREKENEDSFKKPRLPAGRPAWLNKKINLKDCNKMRMLLSDLNLNTVCEQAKCPNISECFANGEATFMILGDICTRDCQFCAVNKGKPKDLDRDEPGRVKEAVKRLNLKHAVITSVTRDDLPLGGAEIFAETVKHIKEMKNKISIEILIPDFKLNLDAISMVTSSKPDIIGHNVETVPRLYDEVRSASDYKRSLEVLSKIKQFNKDIYTKSGIMLGLGEKEDEVIDVFYDLKHAGCDFLSIGQYLTPSSYHYPVKDYILPSKFEDYKNKALDIGLKYVISGPYVRSSYRAKEYLERGQNKS